MLQNIKQYLTKPKIDSYGTNSIWTDTHISKGMLEAHLDPSTDAASRKPEFMDESVRWISSTAPVSEYKRVLDLGCGPGLYAQRFHDMGYNVTGIDFSERSIAYAKKTSEQTGRNNIEYILQNYLTLNYTDAFDIAVIISYDFCVLSKENRGNFLNSVYKALRPGGKFILDVTTLKNLETQENHTWEYHRNGCFMCGEPHLCLNSTYYYHEDDTNLTQTIVIKDDSYDCFNIWHHNFTQEKLISELNTAGFVDIELYDDVAGNRYTDDGNSIAVVAVK